MNFANVRTFLPFDTDDITVIALDDGRVATQAGRAIFHFTPMEATSLGDCLIKAAIVVGCPTYSEAFLAGVREGKAGKPPGSPPQIMDLAAAGTSGRQPLITEAMVDRAEDAWEQYWNDNVGIMSGRNSMRACLTHVLREVLGGAA